MDRMSNISTSADVDMNAIVKNFTSAEADIRYDIRAGADSL